MSNKTLTEKSPLIQHESTENESVIAGKMQIIFHYADAENQHQEVQQVYPYPWKAMIVLNIAIVGSNIVYSALNAVFAVYFSSVLPTYLLCIYSQWFLFNDDVSTALTNTYASFLNFVAPLGGILSDRVLGKESNPVNCKEITEHNY